MVMTCNVEIEPPRGLDAVTSILGLAPVPAEVKNVQTLKPSRERRIRSGKAHAMFEFCCSKDSNLGAVNESRGIPHFRLHREQTNLENDQDNQSLLTM